MDSKKNAARRAMQLISNNQRIGLGNGSTIALMADSIREMAGQGLRLDLYSSSAGTRDLLKQYELPVLDFADCRGLDFYFDGCDQLDQRLNALKSGGGIHTHEKLMASMADCFAIVADHTKLTGTFSPAIPLLIEIIPEARAWTEVQVAREFPGARFTLRLDPAGRDPQRSPNNNFLAEIHFAAWPALDTINPRLESIPGCLTSSLFTGMAKMAILGYPDGARILERESSGKSNN